EMLPPEKKSLQELLEMVNDKDLGKLPGPEPVPETQEISEEQRTESLKLLLDLGRSVKTLFENPTFRNLTLRQRQQLPSYMATRIAAALKVYVSGECSPEAFVKKLEDIIIAKASPGHPTDQIRELLNIAREKGITMMDKMRARIKADPSSDFSFLNDD